MKKSFNGVSVSMPKVFKREVEECMEAFIDFLKEIPAGAPEVKYNQSLSIESSAENKADSTSLLEECPEENKIIQLNDCEDNNQQVFFVECPEKERASALLCAALGWAQEYQPDSSIDRIFFVGGDNETLKNIKQDVEGTDLENLLRVPAELPHSAFTAEKTNVSVIDVFLTTQQTLCEAILSTSRKYQLHDSPVQPNKYCLKKTLVMVEDAHLLDQVFRDAASGSLSLCVIENFITKFQIGAHSDPLLMNAIEISEILRRVLFRGIMLHKGRETDPSFSLEELCSLLNSSNIMGFDFQNFGGTKHLNDPNISKIFKFLLLLVNTMVDSEATKQTDKHSIFRMYASESDTCPYETCKSTPCKSINFVCLDASFIMKKLMKMDPFALILSSASLTPFKYLKTELGIRKAKEFTGKSSVEDHQMFARILTCGAGGYFFNSSYNRRFDSDYLCSLGRTILELAKVTPPGEGIVIYVSSYEFQDMCVVNWQKCAPNKKSLWDTIREYKDIFTISKGDAWQSHLVERLNNSQKSKGSCVLAVLRSQASEYTFLPIQSRRVVVIVGVPFIPTDHPKVQLKIQYMKSAALAPGTSNMKFQLASDFERWESYKPVRQVVDNLINSLSDYSVILLLDTRYDSKSLSSWLGEKIIKEKRLFELLEELTDFFQLVKNRIQCIQDKKENATQTSTQFGSVPKWEMEKLHLEFRKLRNRNDNYEKCLLSLKDQFRGACDRQLELEQKLKEPVSPRKRPFPE